MRRDTTIWACPVPDCDNWQWGDVCDAPECSQCGSEMEPDQQSAFDTYFCNQYHQQENGK